MAETDAEAEHSITAATEVHFWIFESLVAIYVMELVCR